VSKLFGVTVVLLVQRGRHTHNKML